MPEPRPTSRWRRRGWRKRLLLLAIGTVIGLLLVEAGLRLMAVSYPLPYVPDPYCGSRLRPGMTALFSAEGRQVVHINRHGMRDREHSQAKPPGTARIAVLGDSYTEAFQVAREDTYWAVAARELERRGVFPGRRVEVLNFGVSGFSTAQSLEMLRHYVWPFEPDLVVLAVTTGNDISENSRELSRGVRPYYVLRDETLVLDRSFRHHPHYVDALSRSSRLKVSLINRIRILQVLREMRARARLDPPAPTGIGAEAGLDPAYREPQDEAWVEAWRITEQLLSRMQHEVERHGSRLYVVTLSNGIQVHPDPQVRAAAQRQWEVENLFYPDRRIADYCVENGIPVITLAPRLQKYAEERQVYLHGFANTRMGTGHWNEHGHREAGQRLAADIAAAETAENGPGAP